MRFRYLLMFFTLSGAGTCAFFGVQEYGLSARSSQQPEEISLRDLIKRGREGNPNIILTDFAIFEDYVYEKKITGRWTKVWVPIIPTNENDPDASKPAAIRAFIFSEEVGSDEEVRRQFDRPKLRGMINPEAAKPGVLGGILIRKSYPGTDPSKSIIIEEGKEPAGVFKLALYCLGVLLLVGLTGGIWFLAQRIDQMEAEEKRSAKNQNST